MTALVPATRGLDPQPQVCAGTRFNHEQGASRAAGREEASPCCLDMRPFGSALAAPRGRGCPSSVAQLGSSTSQGGLLAADLN